VVFLKKGMGHPLGVDEVGLAIFFAFTVDLIGKKGTAEEKRVLGELERVISTPTSDYWGTGGGTR